MERRGKGDKSCPLNTRFRIGFDTDATNDYFDRDAEPGDFDLTVNGESVYDYSLNLWNGVANLNVSLPSGVAVGDELEYVAQVSDSARVEPFNERWRLEVASAVKRPSGRSGRRKKPPSLGGDGDTDTASRLALPAVVEVREGKWKNHSFNRESAIKVMGSDDRGYDFFIKHG